MGSWRCSYDPLPWSCRRARSLAGRWLAWGACLAGLLGSALAGEPIPLTTGPGNDTEAAWSPDGERIVFQSDRSGTLGLYVLDLPTGDTRPLVVGPGHACFPAWSPDGKGVVYSYAHFTATAFERQADGYNLFRVAAEGGKPRRLTQGLHRDYCPAFGPDGKTIWFSSDRDRGKNDNAVGLHTVAPAGGDPVAVCRWPGRDRALVEPCFSPETGVLAFSRLNGFRDNWTIHLARVDNPADSFPVTDPHGSFYSPRWSPAGPTLACTGFQVGDDGWNVYLIDARTGNRIRVDTGPGNSRSPAWSPDGRQLVFENNRSGGYKLYRLDVPPFPPSSAPQAARAEPAADQVLHVSFARQPGETIVDRSPQGNTIRINGEPAWSQGSLSFRPGASLAIPAAQGFDFGSGAFAVRAVVRVPEDCQFAMILMGEYPGNRLGWQLYVGDDRRAWFNSRTTDLLYRGAKSDEPLPTHRPVTLIGTRDAAGGVRLFVDGNLQRVASQDALFAYGEPVQVRIGSQHDGSAPFPGGIGEVAVFRRTLSSEEILGDSLARFWKRAERP